MQNYLLTRRCNEIDKGEPLIGMQMWCEWGELWREYGEDFHSNHQCETLKDACDALPDCVMLSFAYADALHAAKKSTEAVAVYEVCYPTTLSAVQFVCSQRCSCFPAAVPR